MNRISVMHMLDALNVGGAERVAINLANLLPRDQYLTYLCTTRTDGPFSYLVEPHVSRLSLRRSSTFDASALRRLVTFVRTRDIRILHAHGSSLFFARLVSLFPPYPVVVWHDHYGRYMYNDRPAWLYRAATRKVGGVIAVNRPLAEWSRHILDVPSQRVWYIPNLVQISGGIQAGGVELPGKPGNRIVCVANFRPQKDHSNLLRAMALLKTKAPEAQLLLIGDTADPAYRDGVLREIVDLGLDRCVSYLGPRQDVGTILRSCDIGVLSSRSEGLPVALLEYGIVGMPVVATNVGQCAEVLEGGAAGILTPPSSPSELAEALFSLIDSHERRKQFGTRLRQRIESMYSPERVIGKVCDVYRRVLAERALRN